MFDIDLFKKANDTHGHPAGDAIVKELAQLVGHEARGYDVFARFGGEEFIFLLRGVPGGLGWPRAKGTCSGRDPCIQI